MAATKKKRPSAAARRPRNGPAARALEAKYRLIEMDLVRPGPHARVLDHAKVDELAKSITEAGLLQPIEVMPCKLTRAGTTIDGYEITFGHHRYAAMQKLDRPHIAAIVTERDELRRELAACDENLVRALSDGERIRLTARSQEIYEALHPETKQYAAGGHAKAKGATATVAVAPSHARQMAQRTGRSERSVRRDQERGKLIAPEAFDALNGTPWDDTAVWAALGKLRRDYQLPAIQIIKERKPATSCEAVALIVSCEPAPVASAASKDDARKRKRDVPLSERGRNPERIEKQRENALIWAKVRDSLLAITGLPLAGDVVPIVSRHDKTGLVDERLSSALRWLEAFCTAWSCRDRTETRTSSDPNGTTTAHGSPAVAAAATEPQP